MSPNPNGWPPGTPEYMKKFTQEEVQKYVDTLNSLPSVRDRQRMVQSVAMGFFLGTLPSSKEKDNNDSA